MFIESLEDLIKLLSIKDKTKYIILGGHFKINFQSENATKNVIKNLMLTYNFHQIPSE